MRSQLLYLKSIIHLLHFFLIFKVFKVKQSAPLIIYMYNSFSALYHAYSVLIGVFFVYNFISRPLFIQKRIFFTSTKSCLNITTFFQGLLHYIIILGSSITVSLITHNVVFINPINGLFYSCFTNKRKVHTVLGLVYKCVVLINSNSNSFKRICTININNKKPLIYASYSLMSIFVLAILSSFSVILKFLYNYILHLFPTKTSCNYFHTII